MANTDRPNGFTPIKTINGEPLAGMIREYSLADRSADAGNNHGDVYVGSPVKLVAGKVLSANSGDTILGVAVAFGDGAVHGRDTYADIDNQSQRNYSPLEEITGIVGVVPARGILFQAQTASALNLAVGALADISVAAGAVHGNRTTGNSISEIVGAVNNDITIVEQGLDVTNDTTLANAEHLVMFNTVTNAQ